MTGTKDDKQKPMPRLVLGTMARALLEVSKVATFGAEKYSPDNWLKVESGLERYTDAKDRHRLEGAISEYDSESGLLHAAHEAWNALAVLELKLRAADAVTKHSGNQGIHISEEQIKNLDELSAEVASMEMPKTWVKPVIDVDKFCEMVRNTCVKVEEERKALSSMCKQYRDLEKPETWKQGDLVTVEFDDCTFIGEFAGLNESGSGVDLIRSKCGTKSWCSLSNITSVEARS